MLFICQGSIPNTLCSARNMLRIFPSCCPCHLLRFLSGNSVILSQVFYLVNNFFKLFSKFFPSRFYCFFAVDFHYSTEAFHLSITIFIFTYKNIPIDLTLPKWGHSLLLLRLHNMKLCGQLIYVKGQIVVLIKPK